MSSILTRALSSLLKIERGKMSCLRSDYGGIEANNQLPRKTTLLEQVTDEGLPAPKQRSLRRSDHRVIQANNQLPKL